LQYNNDEMSENITVKDYMTKNPFVLSPTEDIEVAFDSLIERSIRQAPVVKNGRLVGIITDRDLRVTLVDNLRKPNQIVNEVMSINPITILENETIKEAAKKIFIHKLNALPVISESGMLVGILTT